MLKYIGAGFTLFAVPTSYYGYQRRQKFLQDPIMQRALLNLQKDKRVIDFCGENIKPGWIISKKEQPNDNWVKFDLTVKGLSGKLKTTVIGDYLKHNELQLLESERVQYYQDKQQDEAKMNEKLVELEAKVKASKGKITSEESAAEEKQILEQFKAKQQEYIPVDFDAYSILDKPTLDNLPKIKLQDSIKEEEKIWRISSLTTYVDDETKILILPLPESKRSVKIQDTKYDFKIYEDLIKKHLAKEEELQVNEKVVRFEDKTQEEIQNDIKKKRRTQIQMMNKIRTYQFFIMAAVGFLYIFVYRRFLAGKSVMNSVIYHQTVNYVKASSKIQNVLGQQLQVMNCNGKIWPMKSNVDFDLIVFGSQQKGKIRVQTDYDKSNQKWKINQIDLITRQGTTQIV